jgi:tetratricopeptide (TPR) repeat protein
MNNKYKIFLSSILIGLLFLSPEFSIAQNEGYTSDPTVIRLIRQGIDAHKNNDFQTAIKFFQEAYALEPANVLVKENLSIAHNNYGKYLTERTDYEKALKEFRLAIYFDKGNKMGDENLDSLLVQRGIKASNPQVRMQLAEKLRSDANFELALVEYEKALSLSKTPDQNIYIGIGDVYYILFLRDGQSTNDINKAIDSYKKALSIKETAKAYIKVGDGFLGMKDVISAIEQYKRAIQLEPLSQDALAANLRGWNEAVRLAPLVAENHIGLASALQLKGDFPNAEEEYNQALKLDPENSIAQKGLNSLAQDKQKARGNQFVEGALKLQSQGKFDEAIQNYVKAIELTPNNASLHYNIGTAFQAKNDFDHAEKAYMKALEMDPKNDKAKSALDSLSKQQSAKKLQELSSRALELQNSGNFQESITAYQAALSFNPNDHSLIYNLGTAFQASGDLTNAQTQYQKAIDLDKGNQTYQNALKILKVQLATPLIQSAINKQTSNDLPGAIADYSKALEYSPDDAQTHFNLATAYQGNNQNDQAISSYLKASQLDPKGQADAFFFLAGIYEEKKVKNSAIENFQKYIQNAPSGTYVNDAKERITYLKTLKP